MDNILIPRNIVIRENVKINENSVQHI
jgi:hypothetical protein